MSRFRFTTFKQVRLSQRAWPYVPALLSYADSYSKIVQDAYYKWL